MNRKGLHNKFLLVQIIVAIVQILSTIILAILALNIQNAMLNLQTEARRADISILVDPIYNQNWTFIVPGGAYLTVNGTLCNEGTRVAIIKQIELSMIYLFSDNTTYTLTKSLNPPKDCGWNNNTIEENECRTFSLTMYAHHYTVVNSRTGDLLQIGNSRSDQFGILVKYYDGIDEKENFQTFRT